VIQKKLKLGPGNKLIPTSDYEKKMIAKALAEKGKKKKSNSTPFKDLKSFLSAQERSKVIKRGATRPPDGGDLFRTLIE
jgi:hypothetical protein